MDTDFYLRTQITRIERIYFLQRIMRITRIALIIFLQELPEIIQKFSINNLIKFRFTKHPIMSVTM